MKKYFAIFRVPVATMEEWKKTTSQEEMMAQGKKLGEDMSTWMAKHASSFVEKGWPLGKTKTVSVDGVKDTRNDLNFCQIVEAETHEAACEIFADCPHATIPNATIDVMEIPHMGM
ncbi:MAG: hypothetical protein JWL87_197 [Candidatus Adlerbacteria bacterium]|nr:hypothetical protein [Candidatus Adlerbacteria bacterium]